MMRIYVKRDLIHVKRDLIHVKRDLIHVKRDLIHVKRDLIHVKRDLIHVKRNDQLKEGHAPLFQRLRQHRVVCVVEHLCSNDSLV